MDLLFDCLLRTWFAGHHDAGWGRALFGPTVGTALSPIHTGLWPGLDLSTLAAPPGPRAPH